MPSHSHTPSSSAQSTTAPAARRSSAHHGDAQDSLGNHALAELVASKSAGQLSWEAALGQALGSKLYEALSKQLSEDELRQAAEGAVGSAMRKLGELIRDKADVSDQEAAAALVSALDAEITRIAGAAATGEVADELRKFVDENPLLVTTAAIGAATAWVLANQGIGMLSSQLQLGGGHALIGGVDPGKTLELAVQQVRVGYRYKGGGTDLKVLGDYFADDSWKVTGGFSQTTDLGGQLSLSGLHHQRDADESRTRLSLGYAQDGLAASAFWERERSFGSDVSTLGGQLSASRDDWSAYMRAQAATDGSHEAALGVSQQLGTDRSWGVEGFSSGDGRGTADHGLRAVFRWRF